MSKATNKLDFYLTFEKFGKILDIDRECLSNLVMFKYLFLFFYLFTVSCKRETPSVNPQVVSDTGFSNPLLPSGPDPLVIQSDTNYYFTHTTGNSLVIYKTSKMSDLKNAVIKTIWSPPASGPYSKDIWAPELH